MTFNVLEEERRTASFADAIGDLCDLQNGIHWGVNCFHFARTLQCCHPVTQIFVGQRFLRSQNADIRHGDRLSCIKVARCRFPISDFQLPIYNARRSALDLGRCSET